MTFFTSGQHLGHRNISTNSEKCVSPSIHRTKRIFWRTVFFGCKTNQLSRRRETGLKKSAVRIASATEIPNASR